jgi:hypothetical protein
VDAELVDRARAEVLLPHARSAHHGDVPVAGGGPRRPLERAYLAALERVAAWRTDGDQLVLVDGGGVELLRYRAS